jgi:hypothetical protein
VKITGEQYEMVRAAVRQSCLRCFGTGEIAQNYPPMSQTTDWRVVPCPECGGRKVIAALEEMRKEWEQLEKEAAIPMVAPTRCKNCGHVDLKGNMDMARLQYAVAWAYQAIGAHWPNVDALDNLSAVHRGEVPPHEWPVVPPAEAEEMKRCFNSEHTENKEQ